MNRKEREEVFKAINDVANRVNDVSQKLDGVMQKLNRDSNERITVNNDTISSIAEGRRIHSTLLMFHMYLCPSIVISSRCFLLTSSIDLHPLEIHSHE